MFGLQSQTLWQEATIFSVREASQHNKASSHSGQKPDAKMQIQNK